MRMNQLLARSPFLYGIPVADVYTFSAKERDAESGFSVTSLRLVSSSSLSQNQVVKLVR